MGKCKVKTEVTMFSYLSGEEIGTLTVCEKTYCFPFLRGEGLAKVIFRQMPKTLAKQFNLTGGETQMVSKDGKQFVQLLGGYMGLTDLTFTTSIQEL